MTSCIRRSYFSDLILQINEFLRTIVWTETSHFAVNFVHSFSEGLDMCSLVIVPRIFQFHKSGRVAITITTFPWIYIISLNLMITVNWYPQSHWFKTVDHRLLSGTSADIWEDQRHIQTNFKWKRYWDLIVTQRALLKKATDLLDVLKSLNDAFAQERDGIHIRVAY